MPTQDNHSGKAQGLLQREFLVRAISAMILAPFVLIILNFGGYPFVFLVALCVSLVWYEWAMIVKHDDAGPLSIFPAGLIIFISCCLFGFGYSIPALLFAGGLFLFLFTSEFARQRSVWNVCGLIFSLGAGVSLIWLHEHEGTGLILVFAIFALVWASDIGAYICGKLFGGPKLWERVSPNKTWSGALGGFVSGTSAAHAILWLAEKEMGIKLAVVIAVLAIISQLGDLAESALKRYFSVKDSGQIIPGHGGVLDRVDGLIFVSISCALMTQFGFIL